MPNASTNAKASGASLAQCTLITVVNAWDCSGCNHPFSRNQPRCCSNSESAKSSPNRCRTGAERRFTVLRNHRRELFQDDVFHVGVCRVEQRDLLAGDRLMNVRAHPGPDFQFRTDIT